MNYIIVALVIFTFGVPFLAGLVYSIKANREAALHYRRLRLVAEQEEHSRRVARQAKEAAEPGRFHEMVRNRPLPQDSCKTCSSGGMVISETAGIVSWDICPDCLGNGKGGDRREAKP